MNLDRKVEIARKAIASIAEHDDAPIAEVESALSHLANVLIADARAMVRRRGLKVAAPKTEGN